MVRALEWAALTALFGLLVALVAMPQAVAGRWLLWTVYGLLPLAGGVAVRRLAGPLPHARVVRPKLVGGFLCYLMMTALCLRDLRNGSAPTGPEIVVLCVLGGVSLILGVLAVIRAPVAETDGV